MASNTNRKCLHASSGFYLANAIDQKPIRVAQVVGKMVGGGVESVVMNYYRHIDRSKVQFDFLVDEDSTYVPEEEITALGGRVFRIPPYQHPIRYRRELICLMREQQWPIVHSNINTLSVFPLSAAKKVGVPIRIAHSHSTMGKGEFAKNAMKLMLRPFANVYPTVRFACSHYAGEWLFGKNADFTVIPNGIELDKFQFDPVIRQETRKELGIADDTFLIGHVGRFMPQKNQAFLVDVLADLLPKRSNTMLAFVGDGPDRPAVQQHAVELGIADYVLFLGQRSDVNRLYQAFDVFCLPSLYEGLGMVAVEAQVAGLPCLLGDAVPLEADVTTQSHFLQIADVKPWSEALSNLPVSDYSDQVDVTSTSKFIPIDSHEEWSSSISALGPGTRIGSSEKVFSDYDISVNARKLASMYLKLFEKK